MVHGSDYEALSDRSVASLVQTGTDPEYALSFRFSFGPLQIWQKLALAPASTSASIDSGLSMCPARDKHEPNCRH